MKKAKRLTALLLALIMVMSITACGKKEGGEENTGGTETTGATLSAEEQFAKEKAEYLAMTPEQLQEKYVKDPTAVTTEEYIALVSTLKYTDVEVNKTYGLVLSDNPTEKLFKTFKKNQALKNVDGESAYKTLITSEWQQVRGYAIKETNAKKLKLKIPETTALLTTEKDPYPLCQLLNLIITRSDFALTGVRDFIKRTAKDEDKNVRMETASSVPLATCLGSEKIDYLSELVDIQIELMNDEDIDVKNKAFTNCGFYGDEKVIDTLEAVLKDKSQVASHTNALYGLSDLWFDSPKHESTSERAYRVTMNYYKTTFKETSGEYKDSLNAITSSKGTSFDDWKKRATYYNPTEIEKVMMEIILNPDLKITARTEAVKAMGIHCSKAQLEANKGKIDALTDKNAKSVQMSYDRILGDAK